MPSELKSHFSQQTQTKLTNISSVKKMLLPHYWHKGQITNTVTSWVRLHTHSVQSLLSFSPRKLIFRWLTTLSKEIVILPCPAWSWNSARFVLMQSGGGCVSERKLRVTSNKSPLDGKYRMHEEGSLQGFVLLQSASTCTAVFKCTWRIATAQLVCPLFQIDRKNNDKEPSGWEQTWDT